MMIRINDIPRWRGLGGGWTSRKHCKQMYSMTRFILKNIIQTGLLAAILMSIHISCKSQYRPSLFFREDWKEIPAATPVTQEHVSNPDMVLCLYGPGCDSIKKSHHASPADDPYYIWSGLCLGNWAVTLKNRTSYADLHEYAKIVWRSKQSGLRNLRIILKLADGTWLVSDQCDGQSKDWRTHEFNMEDVNWYLLDIQTIVEGLPASNPDLSRVDEIGFTDLMRGGQSNACSRLDWIEVYGRGVGK
jgi:hypothetical protein